jgi:hypothetical protein
MRWYDPVGGTTYHGHVHGIVCKSAVTVRSLDPAPATIAARVRGGVNASGVRSRMCLSTFPSRCAISANDRTRPEARSAIQVVASIDPKTGEETINVATIPHIGQTTVNCPSSPGDRSWPATAYDPRSGTLFMPLNELCANTTPSPLDPGQAYTGGGRAVFARVKMSDSGRRCKIRCSTGCRGTLGRSAFGETQPPTQPPEHIFVRLQIGAAAEPFSLKDE